MFLVFEKSFGLIKNGQTRRLITLKIYFEKKKTVILHNVWCVIQTGWTVGSDKLLNYFTGKKNIQFVIKESYFI